MGWLWPFSLFKFILFLERHCWVIYPQPNPKMWLSLVQQLLRPFVCIFPHTLKTGMLEPVLGSIFSESKFPQAVLGDLFIQVQ